MTIELRPIQSDAEMAALHALIRNAFAITRSIADREFDGFQREWALGAFDDGALIGSGASIPVQVTLNGAPVAGSGVTAIATAPSHRRRGVLRRIMGRLLQEAHERGEAVSLLTASRGAIYQRFGYGHASDDVRYSIDPREIVFAEEQPVAGRTWWGCAPDALSMLRRVHAAYVQRGNLGAERLDSWWTQRTTHDDGADHDVFAGVYFGDDDQPRGYVLYTLEDQKFSDAQTMTITEFVTLDEASFRGAWDFIRRHDLVRTVKTEWLAIAADDLAPLLLLEPRALNRRTMDGIWMRLVNAEAALAARPYSADAALSIRVHGDALCPWNNGTYQLASEGGRTQVSRTSVEPDIELGPNALASLIAGYRPATVLSRAGRVRGRPEALRIADALFATEYAPHCLEGF